jgi:nucleotide-binding universal stress UspA family protein
MPPSRILVPVDFSERCAGAVRYAEALQQLFDIRITLLNIVPPPQYDFGAMEMAASVLEEQMRNQSSLATKELESFLADELPGLRTDRVIREGDPATEIVAVAHELNIDLIMMPTHGYGRFRRFILGSVTAKVLHDADCPVWTGVHMEAPTWEAVHFRQVTAAIDLGEQSDRTVGWAARFAAAAGAKLALVHATPAIEARAGESFDPQWSRHVEEAVREEVAALQSRLSLDVPFHIASGEAAQTVCDASAAIGTDLLVIGRGSAAGVFGRLRANSYSIIRESRCPVVSV